MKKIGKSVNSSQGLTDHRRLIWSKLLPILRLAVTFFCAHQRQEAGQMICGICRLVKCKRSIKEK